MRKNKHFTNLKTIQILGIGLIFIFALPQFTFSQSEFKYNIGIFYGPTKGGFNETVSIDNFETYRLLSNYAIGQMYGVAISKTLKAKTSIEVSLSQKRFSNWDANGQSELFMDTKTTISESTFSLEKTLLQNLPFEFFAGAGLNMALMQFSFPSDYLNTIPVNDAPVNRNAYSFGLNISSKILYPIGKNSDIYFKIRYKQSLFKEIYVVEKNYSMIDVMIGINFKLFREKNFYKID